MNSMWIVIFDDEVEAAAATRLPTLRNFQRKH